MLLERDPNQEGETLIMDGLKEAYRYIYLPYLEVMLGDSPLALMCSMLEVQVLL